MINPFKIYLDTITAKECKEKTGVSKQALHAWKTGKARPKYETLLLLCGSKYDLRDAIDHFIKLKADRDDHHGFCANYFM